MMIKSFFLLLLLLFLLGSFLFLLFLFLFKLPFLELFFVIFTHEHQSMERQNASSHCTNIDCEHHVVILG